MTAPAGHPNLTMPIEEARAHLEAHRRERFQWLESVSTGLIEPLVFVAHAASPAGRSLRPVTLEELLLTQPGWSRPRARAAVSGLMDRLGLRRGDRPVGPDDITVGWIVDGRSNGNRFHALVNALQERRPPWPGFPFEAEPEAKGEQTGRDNAWGSQW